MPRNLKSVAAYERRPAPLFWSPDTYQVNITKGGMIGRTPANKLVQTAKSVGNQVRMTVIVLGVVERDSHDSAGRHLCDRTTCRQMIAKGPLGDHDVHGGFRQHPYRAGHAQKENREQSFQSDCLDEVG